MQTTTSFITSHSPSAPLLAINYQRTCLSWNRKVSVSPHIAAFGWTVGPSLWAIYSSSRHGDIPSPADADPREVDDFEEDARSFERIIRDSQHGKKPDVDLLEVDDDEEEASNITRYRILKESNRLRDLQEEHYRQNRALYREAVGLDPDGEDDDDFENVEKDIKLSSDSDDLFSAVDVVVAHMKKREQLSKLNKGDARTDKSEEEGFDGQQIKDADDELEEEDEQEIPAKKAKLKGAGKITTSEAEEFKEDEEPEGDLDVEEDDVEEEDDLLRDPSFDLDLGIEEDLDQIKEPTFVKTLSELLDEARVVPILVDGDQDAEITGIQFDSQLVKPGNMFVCCPGCPEDGHSHLAEAADKGAVVIVATMEVSVQQNVKAVVIVKDTKSILSVLSAAFYDYPSRKISIVGIVGSKGQTSAYLLKSMYEAMGHKAGLVSTIANYVYAKKCIEASKIALDAVSIQSLMATMVHNNTDVCIMEVCPQVMAPDYWKEVNFDIAVLTSLVNNQPSMLATDEEDANLQAHVFKKMLDPKRHAKVVNLDDTNASFFISRGSSDVPLVTFSMDNREADVYALEVQLSLFETEILVHTPRGNVEISSGLLGRHNVYGILAAVAVGIAVNVPLEVIVEGIEEVDAVPGRCELIDEEQAFAVIVDHARTPDALAQLLDTVKECGARRLITVIGCEGDRERGKRPVMAKVATDKSEVSILTSDNPGKEDPLYILDDMLAGVGWSMKEYLEHGDRDYYPPLHNGHRIFVHDIRPIAVRAAVAMGEEGDAVVVAGKGHETFQILGDKKEYMDDREECREALQHVDALHAAGIDTSEFPWRFPGSH